MFFISKIHKLFMVLSDLILFPDLVSKQKGKNSSPEEEV